MLWTSPPARRLLHRRVRQFRCRVHLAGAHVASLMSCLSQFSTMSYVHLCYTNTYDHSPCSCLSYGRCICIFICIFICICVCVNLYLYLVTNNAERAMYYLPPLSLHSLRNNVFVSISIFIFVLTIFVFVSLISDQQCGKAC